MATKRTQSGEPARGDRWVEIQVRGGVWRWRRMQQQLVEAESSDFESRDAAEEAAAEDAENEGLDIYVGPAEDRS